MHKKILSLLIVPLLFSCACHLRAPKEHRYPVVFYNVENLFDTEDGPNQDEEFLPKSKRQWTPERYAQKLAHLAQVLGDIAHGKAAVVGLAEIENRRVVEDLIATEPLAKRNLQIVHYDSPDARGVDCALLYDPQQFQLLSSGVRFVALPDIPTIYTRDILFVTGKMAGETVHFLVGHWPSRLGGDSVSRPRRMAAAETMRAVADSLLVAYPGSKALLMGDFNDDPIDPSVKDGLALCEYAEETTVQDFFSPMIPMYKQGEGTLEYKARWNLFDIMVVSGNLLPHNSKGLRLYRDPESEQFAYVFRRDYLLQQTPRYRSFPYRSFAGGSYKGGYSDHLPVYLYLIK